MKRARASEIQSSADMKFDAPPPPREGFSRNENAREANILEALFLAAAALLLLYKAASD
jgi:hypothetical protein